jgi:hypothetical protein
MSVDTAIFSRAAFSAMFYSRSSTEEAQEKKADTRGYWAILAGDFPVLNKNVHSGD